MRKNKRKVCAISLKTKKQNTKLIRVLFGYIQLNIRKFHYRPFGLNLDEKSKKIKELNKQKARLMEEHKINLAKKNKVKLLSGTF